MAMSRQQLQKSREHWVKAERDAKQRAAHAHDMHVRRERELAELDADPVVLPLKHIVGDDFSEMWGYHPPVHDGIDLICPASEPLIAMCRAKVIRADAAGWWGKGAPADQALKARGDGIIVLRSLITAGPVKKGMNLCYGHAEHAKVRVGQTVEAGDVIGAAGFANAWHCHFMVNMRDDAKGVGEQDPRPILEYAAKS